MTQPAPLLLKKSKISQPWTVPVDALEMPPLRSLGRSRASLPPKGRAEVPEP